MAKMNENEFNSEFLLTLISALEKKGYTVIPIEPTDDMMDAWYEGAEAARDAHFEKRRRLNDARAEEGKMTFPYGIAPVEWFPQAYRAMLSEVSKKWREKRP